MLDVIEAPRQTVINTARGLERRAGRRAGGGSAELGRNRPHDFFGHQAEGGEFAADDADQAGDAVGRGVIEDRVGARQIARLGARCRRGPVQGPNAGPGAQCAMRGNPRHKHLGLGQQQVDLPGRDGHIVRRADGFIGRAQDAHRADRNEDVSVRRRLAAIDDGVHQSGSHGNHGAPPKRNRQVNVRQGGNPLRPWARGIDDNCAPICCLTTFDRSTT
jgi:hypothetical protein